jgi:hypothetical protein
LQVRFYFVLLISCSQLLPLVITTIFLLLEWIFLRNRRQTLLRCGSMSEACWLSRASSAVCNQGAFVLRSKYCTGIQICKLYRCSLPENQNWEKRSRHIYVIRGSKQILT